jgi:hypothetical protein
LIDLRQPAGVATVTGRALPVAGDEQRTCASLLLESIAIRHKIPLLKRAERVPRSEDPR